MAPRTRNSIESRVLPQPALPQTRVGLPRGRPPPVISSRPWIPVGAFGNKRFKEPEPESELAFAIEPSFKGRRSMFGQSSRHATARPDLNQGIFWHSANQGKSAEYSI